MAPGQNMPLCRFKSDLARPRLLRTGGPLPEVPKLLDDHAGEMLAVYQLPEPHRKRMRSTNTLEPLNQELKRRTRVGRISPDKPSYLRLMTALAIEQSEK